MLRGWREMELRGRFDYVWKLGNEEVAQFFDLGDRVVTVSRSSEKLVEDRQMRADFIIRDRLPVMTDRDVKCVGYALEPFGEERQSNGSLQAGIVREGSERLGNVPPARQRRALQLVLKS